MSKRKTLFRKRAPKTQKEAIREYCSVRRAEDKKRHQQAPPEKFIPGAKDQGQRTSSINCVEDRSVQAAPKESSVGKVYRGETKYIDREPKKQRNYVVVRDVPRGVTVAKLKTVKQFDESGKNTDKALVEINHERYGLQNRTGVDFQRFDTNLMSGKPLDLKDRDVFPEGKERFTLSNKDKDKALFHVGIRKRRKKKK